MGNQQNSHSAPASHDDFDTLQRGLTVEMIATRRCDLEICGKNDLISEVVERMSRLDVRYDYLPVTDAEGDRGERIVGLYSTRAGAAEAVASTERVHERLCPLSEDLLIGAKASILEYIGDGHARPVRLVVSEAGVDGLVTLADLRKPPARVALFALVIGFEVTMSNVIRGRFPCDRWMRYLTCSRRQKLDRQIEKSQAGDHDDFVESLLFTQFCDKRDVLVKSRTLQHRFSNNEALKKLKRIGDLRDQLAHANDYATSEIGEVVMTLLDLRRCLEVRWLGKANRVPTDVASGADRVPTSISVGMQW